MTREETIRWYEAKLMANQRFGLVGTQHEAAQMALAALRAQQELSRVKNSGMPLAEVIHSLEDQAQDKASFILPDEPDDIFAQDAAMLKAAAELLRKLETLGLV